MQQLLLIIIFLAVAGLVVMAYTIYRRLRDLQKPREGEQNLFLMLQNQINDLSRAMDQKMTETNRSMAQTQESIHKSIQTQFGQSAKIISEVTEKLVKLTFFLQLFYPKRSAEPFVFTR